MITLQIYGILLKTLMSELDNDHSALKQYAQKNIRQFAEDLNKNESQQNKIDQWIRFNAYRLILKIQEKYLNLSVLLLAIGKARNLAEN